MPSLRNAVLILLCVLAFTARAQADLMVLARASVPNAALKQGEVRLVQRDGDTIVQTVLHTRFPNLVKKRIAGNEQKNWADNPDAASYLAALDDALEQYALRKRATEEPVALVIDFVDGLNSDRVDFSFGPVGQDDDGYAVRQAVLWRSLSMSMDYVRRNQEYILADTFRKEAADVLEKLWNARSTKVDAIHE